MKNTARRLGRLGVLLLALVPAGAGCEDMERYDDVDDVAARQAAAETSPWGSHLEIVRLIADDLQTNVSPQDRAHTRYLSFAHLAGTAPKTIAFHRKALSKWINSVSRSQRIVVPAGIGPILNSDRTIYRIDLNDLGWDASTWDKATQDYPYQLDLADSAADFIEEQTGTQLPYVYGDWFVSRTSQPDRYPELAGIPKTRQKLEQMLGVDVARNRREGKDMMRAGFLDSGPSQDNRIVERHATQSGGAYWVSTDFANSTGDQNIFDNPLDFEPDGSEVIFHTGNGLLAYARFAADGKRIDAAARPAGPTCTAPCHDPGLLPVSDVVRDHVIKNKGSFSAADFALLTKLYVPRSVMDERVDHDNAAYAQALVKAGAPIEDPEPLALSINDYRAGLPLTRVAAELHLRPEDLAIRIKSCRDLPPSLGALLRGNGTISREQMEDQFPQIVAALRCGD